MSKHPQAGDGIVDHNGYQRIVDGIAKHIWQTHMNYTGKTR